MITTTTTSIRTAISIFLVQEFFYAVSSSCKTKTALCLAINVAVSLKRFVNRRMCIVQTKTNALREQLSPATEKSLHHFYF